MPQESIERLAQIGKWMKVNTSEVYATHATPLQDLPWGRCTMRPAGGNTILNLFVFDWPKDGKLVVPGLFNKVMNAVLLAGNKVVKARNQNGTVVIDVPAAAPDAIASVIRLQVKGTVANVNTRGGKKMKTGELD